MLEVSTLRSPSKADHHHHHHHHVGGGFTTDDDDFMVVDGNLLDYIDFSSSSRCDVPSFFDADGDILPDLEVDPTELLAEFDGDINPACCHPQEAAHHGVAEEKPPDDDVAIISSQQGHDNIPAGAEEKKIEEGDDGQKKQKDDERAEDELSSAVTTEEGSGSAAARSSSAEGQSKKTKPSSSKKAHGNKRKVDWTPELHRKFVQAVEQLGIDKAVPSRILEIMGIECLTRHNIASHLQKYRSHRKHLMAREAEAANWAQKKRHMYAAAAATATNNKVQVSPTTAIAGAGGGGLFPPLHVWGHPPAAAPPPMLPVWPRHLAPPPWAPATYWQHQHYNAASGKWVGPQAVTQGMPCMPPPPPPRAAMLPRFLVPGMMAPHPMYRPIPPPQTSRTKLVQSLQHQLDAHPSKESIDAAIGDVLVKPWLPLPLGLRPPSLDSVMSELQKQGIPNIPPAATTAS